MREVDVSSFVSCSLCLSRLFINIYFFLGKCYILNYNILVADLFYRYLFYLFFFIVVEI